MSFECTFPHLRYFSSVLLKMLPSQLKLLMLINRCRLGDDNHLAITFSVERDSDIGQSLRQSQDKFVSICHTLLNDHKDDIFDVYHPHSWYQPYSRSEP